MLKDFRSFVLRGNVIDLAVGIMIGAAFTTVVQSFVRDLLTPLLTLFGAGNANFASYAFHVGGARFAYGSFLNALLSLLLVAAVMFFLIVKPVEVMRDRRDRASGTTAEDKTRPCPECRMEVSKQARRCPHCTSQIGMVTEPEPEPER